MPNEFITDEVILNGMIYRRVMKTDCVEPEILVNEIPYVLKFPWVEKPLPDQFRGKFGHKQYAKSIKFSGFPDPKPQKSSLLRKCWQGIVHDFKVVFNLY